MSRTSSAPTAVLAKYKAQYGRLFKEEREEYGEDFIGDIRRVYEGYERAYANDGWKYEASEELLHTELCKGIRFEGHLDKRIIAQDRRWIVDHKAYKVIPDEDERLNDYQILLYLWAYNREHPHDKADGIIWDYLRTKAPTVPEQLKNGELTQRANLDSDEATYVAELRRLNLPVGPYRKFLTQLKERSVRKFYVRIPLPAPSQEMTQAVVEDFKKTAIIMHGIKEYPRHMDRSCKWCEYYQLCSAELRGLDATYIEKTKFEERPIDEETSEEG